MKYKQETKFRTQNVPTHTRTCTYRWSSQAHVRTIVRWLHQIFLILKRKVGGISGNLHTTVGIQSAVASRVGQQSFNNTVKNNRKTIKPKSRQRKGITTATRRPCWSLAPPDWSRPLRVHTIVAPHRGKERRPQLQARAFSHRPVFIFVYRVRLPSQHALPWILASRHIAMTQVWARSAQVRCRGSYLCLGYTHVAYLRIKFTLPIHFSMIDSLPDGALSAWLLIHRVLHVHLAWECFILRRKARGCVILGTFLRMYIDEHDSARVCACARE